MTGSNHALVGILIGKVLPLPIAIPTAVASHFVLDMLPHYGIPARRRDTSSFWQLFFIADFIAALSLGVWTIINHHYAMYVCGQLAVLPDFVWVAHVLRKRSFDFSNVSTRYEKWHIAIQKYEFTRGLWIELPLAAILFYTVILQTK